MKLAVLGPLEATGDDGRVPLTAPTRRRLLAALLTSPGEPVGLDALAEAVWPDGAPDNPVKNLRLSVHRLRRELGEPERISSEAVGYRIHVQPGECDANEFVTLTAQAREAQRQGEPARAEQLLAQALRLWRGAPYPDLADCVFAQPAIERLLEWRLRALELHAEVRIERGAHAEVVPDLVALLAEHPYREHLCDLLMLTLSRSGRQAEALEAYRVMRARLIDELGIEPGDALNARHQAVLGADRARAGFEGAGLPPQLASFVGREGELDALARLLERDREPNTVGTVVVIDGMPGVGKTALAVRLAHRLSATYPGLYLELQGFAAGLEPVSQHTALYRLLSAGGVPDAEIPPELADRAARWRRVTANRRVLLVLDDAVDVEQILPLLPCAPSAAIVTSRRRLADLDDAGFLTLGPLSEPEAAALFRAVTGQRTGHAVHEDSASVADILRVCGRLPLAVRIAAARLRDRPAWRPGDLLARLREDDHRIVVLESGNRSVAASFDVSYRHLDPDLRRSLALLSLHPGADFDSHAAATLTGYPADRVRRHLDELVEVYLLEERGYERYGFHDLVRSFTSRRLTAEITRRDQRTAIRRLAKAYLATLTTAMRAHNPGEAARLPQSPGPAMLPLQDPEAARAWIHREQDCLSALVQLTHETGLHPFTRDLAHVLTDWFDVNGRPREAIAIVKTGLSSARAMRDRLGIAKQLNALGNLHVRTGPNSSVLEHSRAAREQLVELGDAPRAAVVAVNIGAALTIAGNYAEAYRILEPALEEHRRSGNRKAEAWAVKELGTIDRYLGRYQQAISRLRDALSITEELDNDISKVVILDILGVTYRASGHLDGAAEVHREALEISRNMGYVYGQAHALAGLGNALRAQGRAEPAVTTIREALTLADRIGTPMVRFEAHHAFARALTSTGRPTAAINHHQIATEAARHYGAPQEEAHAHEAWGHTYRQLGEPDHARRHWHQAHACYDRLGPPPAATRMATLLQPDGRPDR